MKPDKSLNEISVLRYVRRNISRKKMRSVLTISSIAICLAFFVLLSALTLGIHDYILEIPQFTSGRITVYVEDGKTPLNGSEFKDIEQVVNDYCKEKGTSVTVVPQLIKIFRVEKTSGFMSNDYFLAGVHKDYGFKMWYWGEYDFDEPLLEGKHLNTIAADENGVVLGYGVWKTFFPNNHAGDLIDLAPRNASHFEWGVYTTDQYPLENKTNLNRTIITGIYNVKIIGILKDDPRTENMVYAPINFLLKKFLQYDIENGYYYNRFGVIIEDPEKIDFDQLENEIMEARDGLFGWDNRWELEGSGYIEIKRSLDSWLWLLTFILILIVVFNVNNIMAMAVIQQRREIGVLRSIGITKRGIIGLILVEAITYCLIALIIGVLTGWGLSYYFDMNFVPYKGGLFFSPAKVTPQIILNATILSIGFGFLSSIYPAKSAAGLDPLEAIRYE